jgi:hypothetical protein
VGGKEINPVWAIIGIVVLVAVVGGIWFFRTSPGAGAPGGGEPGRADPILSGPKSPLRGGGSGMPVTGGRPVPGSRGMGGPGQPGGR